MIQLFASIVHQSMGCLDECCWAKMRAKGIVLVKVVIGKSGSTLTTELNWKHLLHSFWHFRISLTRNHPSTKWNKTKRTEHTCNSRKSIRIFTCKNLCNQFSVRSIYCTNKAVFSIDFPPFQPFSLPLKSIVSHLISLPIVKFIAVIISCNNIQQ